MEQLKPILVALNKHRFWVACGATVLICLVVWYLSSSKLTKEADAWAGEITSAQSTVTGIRAAAVSPEHEDVTAYPNPEVEQGMQSLIDAGRVAVAEAWRAQHAKQNQLFVWPSDLPQAARDAFSVLRPIEKKLPYPTPGSQEVPLQFRQSYRDYIARRLPELAKKIGADWIGTEEEAAEGPPAGGGNSGFGPGSSSAGPTSIPVVIWNEDNQSLWLEKTTQFTGKAGNRNENNIPLTIQVMYAQEDLWILEAIFDVIKRTNGDADANDLANIKEIDHIFVGIDATGTTGEVTRLSGAANADPFGGLGPGGGPPGSGGYGSNMGDPSGGLGAPPGAAESQSPDPAENRYVDQDYKALSASAIRGAFTNRSPQNASLAVSKRVPVRIGVQMDERAIFKFLAECANSQPTLEVRQVRINRHEAGEKGKGAAAGGTGVGGSGPGGSGGNFGLGGAGSGAPGGAPPGGGAPGGAPPGSGSGGYPGGAGGGGAAAGTVRSDYTVDVEIYGIVHIFNPVDEERVKVEGTGPGPGDSGVPTQPTAQNLTAIGRDES